MCPAQLIEEAAKDANEKQDILDLDAAELATATALKGLVKKYRFKDAVAEKGDAARIHVGVIAQDVIQAFTDNGLDATRYGIVCYDEWSEYNGEVVEVNANGKYEEQEYQLDGVTFEGTEEEALDAGAEKVTVERDVQTVGRYGVRYEELLAFIIAAM